MTGAGAWLALAAVATCALLAPGCDGGAPAPTHAELARLEARFPGVRDTLERILAVERETHLWLEERDSLIAGGESERVRRGDERIAQMRAGAGFEGQNIFRSDSLVYISVGAKRGIGFSAPWWYVGYVHASRSPGEASSWPIPGMDRGPFPGEYRHLADRWYLFSVDDPWQEGPSRE